MELTQLHPHPINKIQTQRTPDTYILDPRFNPIDALFPIIEAPELSLERSFRTPVKLKELICLENTTDNEVLE